MELILRSFANKIINNHAMDGKNLPKSIKVLSWGKNETTDGDVYLNEQTLAVFDSMQEKTGRDEDVALDFGHCTVPGAKEYVAGEPKNIAAYGNPKLVKGDGLYLTDLKWTPLGKEKASNYKDLSPAVTTTKDGIVTGLHSVALTEAGAVHGLKFYSAEFTEMIKCMSDNDYNKNGANAGVNKVGDKYEVNMKPCDVDDMGGMDVSEFDADDHKAKYGDVEYADSENHKYPIDTKEHAKAAWSYINMPKNAGKYDSTKLSTIKSKIKDAAKRHGIDISDDSGDKTKTMSANNPSFPDAYKAQPWYYNTMNDSIIKKMAAAIGMDGETDAQKVLFAFLANWEGLKAEISQQLTRKDNTLDGGLKSFSATIELMKNEIEELKRTNKEEVSRHSKFERESLINQANKEGKHIPLSANEIESIDVKVLHSIVSNLPKNVVPMNSKMRILNADGKRKVDREAVVAMFNEQTSK